MKGKHYYPSTIYLASHLREKGNDQVKYPPDIYVFAVSKIPLFYKDRHASSANRDRQEAVNVMEGGKTRE